MSVAHDRGVRRPALQLSLKRRHIRADHETFWKSIEPGPRRPPQWSSPSRPGLGRGRGVLETTGESNLLLPFQDWGLLDEMAHSPGGDGLGSLERPQSDTPSDSLSTATARVRHVRHLHWVLRHVRVYLHFEASD